MPHNDNGQGNSLIDPDQQGDDHGQAPGGNGDGDILEAGSPPQLAAAVVPAQFVPFLNSLPASFATAFEADAPGGMPWTPIVITGSSYQLPPAAQPAALFAAISTPQSSPIVLAGKQTVGLINDSSVPLTVVDNANPFQYVATGTGGMTLFAEAKNGAFVAQGGNNAVVTGQAHMGAWTFDMEGGTNQVWALAGNNTVNTAAGSQNEIVFGTGNNIAFSAGQDLIFGGSGNDTISASGNNDTVVGGSGNMSFLNASTIAGAQNSLIFGGSGTLNVNGGTGSVTVVGGKGGGTFFGGSAGDNVMFGGSGPVTMVGGGSGDLIVGGTNGGDLLVAGAGNETLIAGTGGNSSLWGGTGNDAMVLSGGNNTVMGGASGNEVIWAGSGSDVIDTNQANVNVIAGTGGMDTVQAGSGNDVFTFINGQAGGTSVINGFNTATDSIDLSGYAPNSAAVTSAGGSTTITLADKTQIVLVGVSHLPSSALG